MLVGKSSFTDLEQILSLTDWNLGRHLEILEQAHLIKKGYEAKRPRIWAETAPQGDRAGAAYIESLQAIVGLVETTDFIRI